MIPALLDLIDDPVISSKPTVAGLYLTLIRDVWRGEPHALDFSEPRELKATGMALRLRVQPRTIFAALAILVERGYLIDHGRGTNHMRRLTLSMCRRVPERITSAA